MPPKPVCSVCNAKPAALKRPKNGVLICADCFFNLFETEVHETIVSNNLLHPGDKVACGASGGKDSTVLMHLMKTLNDRYQYGVELILVSIDEGIVGYRDDSLLTVHRNSEFYQLPLKILSYKELYGWTMDEIVKEIGSKNNCTFCGVFRRQALDRGARIVWANKIVTGHNADDTAETILMNILRSDAPRLQRCASTTTESADSGQISRVKPLKFAYEKEIVLYAHFKKLDYFTTECTYSKEAFRGNVRTLVKDLEAIDPRCINDVIYSGERLPSVVTSTNPSIQKQQDAKTAGPKAQSTNNCGTNTSAACSSPSCGGGGADDDDASLLSNNKCRRCGYLTSQELCRACVLLSALNRGKANIALRETGGKFTDDDDNAVEEMRPNVNCSPAVISHKSQGEKC